MSLPESFHRYGTAVLAKNPEIAHDWSWKSNCCELFIPASSTSGFDIQFLVEPLKVTLFWGVWHTPFDDGHSVLRGKDSFYRH